MANFAQGTYIPKNPDKYIGTYPIEYRSSWEYVMMKCFDEHPMVISWSSESISIPYYNPIAKKWTFYIPDFLIVYIKGDKKIAEMIEVKPENEAHAGSVKTAKDKIVFAINMAKWAAAMTWCKKNGVHFRIMTQADINKYKRK